VNQRIVVNLEIDFEQLRLAKGELAGRIDDDHRNGICPSPLAYLMEVLDSIQDQAAKRVGDIGVFGSLFD
jgi:hypothetical protein